MRIISNGFLYHPSGPKRFMCRDCKCVFIAEEGEYNVLSRCDGAELDACCPQCGARVFVSVRTLGFGTETDIPKQGKKWGIRYRFWS